VGEFSLLHAMNPIRLDFMRQKLQEVGEWEETRDLLLAKQRGEKVMPVDRKWERGGQWLSGVKALDVGCGGGLLSESLARIGADVLGVDASHSNVEIAKLHAARDPGFRTSSSLAYRHVMAEDLLSEKGPNQFDVVCAMEVIEHVKSPRFFLQTLADLVKPGGHLFMSTIARTPLSRFLTIFMAEDVLRLVSPGTHRHDQYINPSELVEHFRSDIPWIKPASSTSLPDRLQFETRGAFYLPLYGKWLLANRDMKKYGSELSNFFFYVRKPL
jgi:polyprenyldihydroxybenzoate methyltransferase/3-demethylubiquinol 3-O-methyltransferase